MFKGGRVYNPRFHIHRIQLSWVSEP